jgi:hypothetical protein
VQAVCEYMRIQVHHFEAETCAVLMLASCDVLHIHTVMCMCECEQCMAVHTAVADTNIQAVVVLWRSQRVFNIVHKV